MMTKLAKQFLALSAVGLAWIPLVCAAEPNVASGTAGAEPLAVGTRAPDFTREAASGKKLSLKHFEGKEPVVLYFYPKDETSGCTTEACGFRDFLHSMAGKGAEIIGISGDSDESHKSFSKHWSLPFDLVSDSDNSLLNLYHVPLLKGTLHSRVTFIIDKKGDIANVIADTMDGAEHVKRASAALEAIEKK